jgi:hypothetical protein
VKFDQEANVRSPLFRKAPYALWLSNPEFPLHPKSARETMATKLPA